MTKLFELREKMSSAVAEYRSLINKEADLPTDEALGDDDTARVTVLEKEIEVLKARIDRLEAASALPEAGPSEDDDGEKSVETVITKQFKTVFDRVPAQVAQAPSVAPGLRAARYLIGKSYAAKHGPQAAAEMISKVYHDDLVAKSVAPLTTGNTATGGVSNLIPVFFSTDIIELLRPLVVVRNAGAATIDTTGGNLTIPRLAGAATATWSTENTDIPTSSETFGSVVLSNHKLVAMVGVSNDLVRRSPLGLDSIVRDDLVAVMARAEDTAFLSGAVTGTVTGGVTYNGPTGLKNQVGIQQFSAAGSSLTNAVSAISGAVTKLQMANTRMIRPAWAMSPMTKNWLSSLRDGVGNFFVFEQELAQGKLYGYPVYTTTNLPIVMTGYGPGGSGGTAGSDIFLFDAADVIIGDTMNVQIDVTDTGAYFDGTSLQSAFSRDLTLFRIIKESDLQLRHPTSVVNLQVDSWTLF